MDMIHIDVIQSDITSLAVDAIVNGADESLVPGGVGSPGTELEFAL